MIDLGVKGSGTLGIPIDAGSVVSSDSPVVKRDCWIVRKELQLFLFPAEKYKFPDSPNRIFAYQSGS